ncbi:Drug resistance protein [Tolypocladium ophioglossoides CBS 100239]|uniref:Drug resistance protein n=1 Tax=Tolypocladium ophioglossoides (strain CBS 100239) TaxID=1163406 RepID=A0A0L0NDV3_TOLOC|nr:Drug resistance protein [Tolypocladium ophioglossoides CBS 100239]
MAEKDTKMASHEPVVTIQEVSEDLLRALDVEKLGRQRPAVFSSTWLEVAFVISMLGSLAMADFVISGFQVVLPALIEPCDIPPESQTWPSSVLTLVAGAFLFPLGRLTDMYGGYVIFNGGLIWFTIWTTAAGFTNNFTMLVVCRAMQGLGAAAFLPAGISLLGRIYRPGPRKNLVFALYGAIAPVGFFSGIIIGGMSQDLLSWRWYFWLGGIIAGVFCVGSLLTSPRDYAEARKMNVRMDWWGVCTTVPGLMFFVYAVTESTNAPQGWATPQIIVTLSLGVLFLGAAVYVEGWVAAAPLIPADIFHTKYRKRMLFCLLLSWGVFSLYLFYSNFYIQLVLGKPALLTAVWFAPRAAGGLVLSIMSGLILHILPGRVLLIISGVSKVLAVLFFALMPDNPNYWAWVFPAMLAEAACVDVLWTVSNVFLTTSLPRHRQGLAGAVISVTLFLGGALFLAVADVAKSQFQGAGMSLKMQYKGVFWIGVGAAGVALLTCCFIRLGKAGCALTVDEKQVIEFETEHVTKSKPRRGTRGSEVTVVESDAETVVGVETENKKDPDLVVVMVPAEQDKT